MTTSSDGPEPSRSGRSQATGISFLRLAILLGVAMLTGCAEEKPDSEVQGAYRFDDGRLVSIRASVGETLRARFFDSGMSRRLQPAGNQRFTAGPDFSGSEPVEAVIEFERGEDGKVDRLVWSPVDAPAQSARRVNWSKPISFESDGVVLSGRLDLPSDGGATRPDIAVVLVHGSGSDAATDFYYTGDFLAGHGIAALTYDKRGTGGSQGELTFNFHQLARDAAAAVEALSVTPELVGASIGLSGYSQGGWTAPLAASMSDRSSFVVVSYGLVGSPAEEARVETRHLLRDRGVGEGKLDDLDELTTAAVEVVASGFESGWEEFERVERMYRKEPWVRYLEGTTVGRFVSYPNWLIRLIGPWMAPAGMPWHYDSMPVLESLEVPMVWLLAGADTSAPLELSLPMLERLKERGRPIDVRVFPGAEHSMLLLPDGYVPAYFRAEVEAVRRLSGLGIRDVVRD